jgi:1-deoxy-D-xylulose-5-phosphate reductoisomerase
MRRISILGSTGSIGRSSLDVARSHPEAIAVAGLSTNRKIEDLARQVEEFKPALAAVGDESLAGEFKDMVEGTETRVVCGEGGLRELASLDGADIVLNALVGSAGIMPSIAAIRSGKDLAIANKECLVAAGEVITREAAAAGVGLIPVDSEHSAVFQCIRGERRADVSRITLTASGGPLKDMTAAEIGEVTAEDALKHPTWDMGQKVTIDSATLLNKGFEVIEASWLFNIPTDRIDILIEKKSIVHCLVEFIDGSVTALLSVPDMRLAIQYALTQPARLETRLERLDLAGMGDIAFDAPDLEKFPCLDLAYQAAGLGGTAPAALSAADEVVVESFLAGRIKFNDIYSILKEVVASHQVMGASDVDSVMRATAWARDRAGSLVKQMGRGD